MREVSSDQGHEEEELEDSSDVSGYHSDSDSAVMASGNSPFFSKSARYNFLSRSGKNAFDFFFFFFMIIICCCLCSFGRLSSAPSCVYVRALS